MRTLQLLTFCLLLMPLMSSVRAQEPIQSAFNTPACAAAPAYKDHLSALVIGVDNYSDSGIPTLLNAGNDAATMASVLSQQGFTVRCFKDINRDQILEEFARISQHMQHFLAVAANANDKRDRLAIVFYAGHGFSNQRDNFIMGKPKNGETSPDQFNIGFSHISDAFAAVKGENYPLLFVIDACRALGNTGGPGTQPAYSSHLLQSNPLPGMVIHSTHAGGTAIDKNIAIGAVNNGLFVSRFAVLLSHPTLAIDDIYILTKRALQSLTHLGVKQTPFNINTESFAMDASWRKSSAPASACDDDLGNFLLASFRTCSGDNTRESRCAKNICSKRLALKDYSPAAKQACLGNMLAHLVADIDALCAQPENLVPFDAIPSIFSDAPAQVLDASIASLELSNAHTMIAINNVKQIQEQDFTVQTANTRPVATQKARDTLFANYRTIDPRIAGPIDIVVPTGGDVKLRDTPNATSSVTRTLSPGTRVLVDCQNILCTADWTGVRVQEDNVTFRGWLPKKQVVDLALAQDRAPAVTLAYEKDGPYLSKSSLQALNVRLDDAKKQPIISAKILVYQNGTRIEDQMRAEARVATLSQILHAAGVIPENIARVILVNSFEAQSERANVRIVALP